MVLGSKYCIRKYIHTYISHGTVNLQGLFNRVKTIYTLSSVSTANPYSNETAKKYWNLFFIC